MEEMDVVSKPRTFQASGKTLKAVASFRVDC